MSASSLPHRIQRKRVKGWKMPPNTVYVGRPTKWGNPFPIGRYLCRQGAIELFEAMFGIEAEEPLDNRQRFFQHRGVKYPVADVRAELHGKNLACWCPPKWERRETRITWVTSPKGY